MTGLVVEGGGRRCIYSAGVLDCFLENGIEFGYVSGVSAGAQAALDFTAGEKGRTKAVIMPDTGYSFGGIKSKLSCNISKIIYDYPYGKYPLNLKAALESDVILELVATDCLTGKAVYFREKRSEQLLLKKLRASCSAPLLYSKVRVDGRSYLDGSIADAIPFERAFECGCDRVVAVLPKPQSEGATDYTKFKYAVKAYYGIKYPRLAEALLNRVERYNAQRDRLEKLERQGKVLIIRPSEKYVGAFEMDRQKLEKTYRIAKKETEKRLGKIKEFINS